MNVFGMMRVKNEARWIRRAVESIAPICDRIVVLDDHSTDGTAREAIAGGADYNICFSPFDGLDEVRDKNYLLDIALETRPDWIICIDGDEVLRDGAASVLLTAMKTTLCRALALPIWYLWDSEGQRRVDGVYGSMTRVSAFRPGPERFEGTASVFGANFHCGNAPQSIIGRGVVDAPLLHYGYMHREDRIRKFRWYNLNDPMNDKEDRYRHTVQGDIAEVPASARLMHAGPLELRPL